MRFSMKSGEVKGKKRKEKEKRSNRDKYTKNDTRFGLSNGKRSYGKP